MVLCNFIQVISPLSVAMQPAGQITADIGSRAELTCVVTGGSAPGSGAAQRVWLKDGHVIVPASSTQDKFLISRVQREDAGMYQCLVRGETESAQSSLQLVLGCEYENVIIYLIGSCYKIHCRCTIVKFLSLKRILEHYIVRTSHILNNSFVKYV